MARRKLSEDATISDVVNSLGDAEEYVRSVLGNMSAFRRDRGEPLVRIGTTGRGVYPHYRLEVVDAPEGDMADDLMNFIDHTVPYHGRNHGALSWQALDMQGEHWSRGSMNYQAVERLLGQLRGLVPR